MFSMRLGGFIGEIDEAEGQGREAVRGWGKGRWPGRRGEQGRADRWPGGR